MKLQRFSRILFAGLPDLLGSLTSRALLAERLLL
jgi:hypothetical protein